MRTVKLQMENRIFYACLEERSNDKTLVIADGAAFGAEMEKSIAF